MITRTSISAPSPPCCGHCQKPENSGGVHLLQCSGCHEISYCCPAHQSADWKSHKALCKQRKKEKELDREKKAKGNAAVAVLLLARAIPVAAAALPPLTYDDCCKDLYKACLYDDSEVVLSILEKGQVDVNWSDEEGCTAAHAACEGGSVECLSILLEYRCDVNVITSTAVTPSLLTCENGHAACLSLLVEHGADLSREDSQGLGPIHVACENGHYEVLKGI
jgi:ankyrin repeat protein